MQAPSEEADWKVLRSLHPVALERFCERVLDEMRVIAADPTRSQHQRYRAIYKLLHERDDEMALAFDDMRRSRAWYRIGYMYRLGLLRPEEFARFAEQTRDGIKRWVEESEADRPARSRRSSSRRRPADC